MAHRDTAGGVPIGSDEIASRTGHISHGKVDDLRETCRFRSEKEREAFPLAAYLDHGSEVHGVSLGAACSYR